jgi:hypothetical protein
MSRSLSRRVFITGSGAACLALPAVVSRGFAEAKKRLKVAAIFTAFSHRLHAHVILENFLEPYLFNGEVVRPNMDVVSLYADQFPANDMARPVAKEYGIPLFPTVAEALTRGSKELAVDAILLIGEHGTYPVDERGVVQYPRKRLFDDCMHVLRAAGRGVPMFIDKHLSYRWDWAREMYDTAKELGVPLMAGSSVPLAERRPPLEVPRDARIEQAVAIHGGPFEIYDFHGLEVLQSMVEQRAGGETGIESVQFLRGDQLWQAAERGEWNLALADAAMAVEYGANTPSLSELVQGTEKRANPPHGILLKYRDGLTGVVLSIGGKGNRFLYSHRLADGAVAATSYYGGPWNNRNLFKALSHAIQTHFVSGRSPYPVERTLLTTGALAAAVESSTGGDAPLKTPQLAIEYEAHDWSNMREMGKTWKILTDAVPEPRGITRGGNGIDRLPPRPTE